MNCVQTESQCTYLLVHHWFADCRENVASEQKKKKKEKKAKAVVKNGVISSQTWKMDSDC